MNEPWSQLEPEERLRQQLRSGRAALPALVTAASLSLMALPIWLPGPLLPQLGLLGVFFWCTHRPEWMPPWAAFLIGLLQDLWMGTPLGVNAMLLALASAILTGQFLVFQSRPFSFAATVFVGVVTCFQLSAWLLFALAGTPPPALLMAMQGLATLLLLPLANVGHGLLLRRLAVDDRQT